MARRRSPRHLWALDPQDENAVPNARIAQALMLCIRRLPGAYPTRDFDDLGAVLAPLLEGHRRLTRAVILAHLAAGPASGDDDATAATTSARVLHDRSIQTLIGEAFARSFPRFRLLFETAERSLESFLERQSFAADRNLDMLVRLIDLPPPETALIRLATAFCYSSINRAIFSFVDTPSRVVNAIETLCDVRGAATMRMFHVSGVLARSCLLEAATAKRSGCDLEDLLRLNATGECLLGTPHEDEKSMAGAVLKPMPSRDASGSLEWPHLEQQQTLLKSALKFAIEQGMPGVNFLLHGAPGTGKTEFVRQLVDEIGATAFLVNDTDEGGEEADRSERLASLQLGQTFAGQQVRAVLVLDEAEDIFQTDYQHPMAGLFGAKAESKAWVNSLLEKNPHPVIWISNRISQLDPAYLRRFSYCLEFPETPQTLRLRIAQDRLGAVGCSDHLIERTSSLPQVSPAHLDTIARFVRMTSDSGLGVDVAASSQIEAQLKAGGHALPPETAQRTTRFDLRYLNIRGQATTGRVLKSLGGLGHGAGATLLFSGPPGTGKTQLAGEIANRLGRRLRVRTASDINSKWYGESEGNVARMFRECNPKSDLLFLDEADILLGSREATGHRADRAVTAEFLRWLEGFEGIFVCATNHADVFDAALARRFTFRLEFEPLRVEQSVELYAELALGWQPSSEKAVALVDGPTRTALSRMDRLTPGDFANAARRVRALDLPADAWLQELQAEHDAKPGARSVRIGFM